MEPAELLKKYFGYDTFRPMQEDVIRTILSLSLIHISEPTRH
mgnify:CR=1 FL=1